MNDGNIPFTSILHLSDDDLKHNRLKLIFNGNWYYHVEDWLPEEQEKLGHESDYFDLFAMYCGDKADIVKESVKTHDPDASKKRFANGDIIFAFIPYSSNKDWVLVNAYRVLDRSKRLVTADEESFAEYAPYFGRLIVHFEDKSRNIALRDSKKIAQIYIKTILEQPCNQPEFIFPGYRNVRGVPYDDLKARLLNSISWQEKLKERRGIYVIGDQSNGRLYVGSATGKDGLYGRWYTYITEGYDRHEQEDGKYPNVKLKEIVNNPAQGMSHIAKYFQYTILETFTEDVENQYILERERWWKQALLSSCKYGGYNANV